MNQDTIRAIVAVAVAKAISVVGVQGLRATSMFASSQRIADRKAA